MVLALMTLVRVSALFSKISCTDKMNNRYRVINYLSESEKEYIEMNEPDRVTSIQFSWQYERCAVLLWALGFLELNQPTQICDVRKIAKVLRGYGSLNILVQDSNIISNEELLDMHTRILYYNWACVDARIKTKRHQQDWIQA